MSMIEPQTEKRILEGKVVSDKMDKTVVVAVTTTRRHPLYQKFYHTTKRYKAHDEKNEYAVGDGVRIAEIRPLSKEKRWSVVEKISSARESTTV